MSETKQKFFQLNINSVLQTVVVGLLSYYFTSLNTTKETVNTTKDAVVSIAASQQYILKQQDELKSSISEQNKLFMPRSEVMFRFQSLESEMNTIKVRIQANDLDIIRLKDKRTN